MSARAPGGSACMLGSTRGTSAMSARSPGGSACTLGSTRVTGGSACTLGSARVTSAALAWLLGACSAVLPPAGNDVPCFVAEGASDPCAERGLVCSVGYCRFPEICNGLDDDLDGSTDEGFDADRDGFTFCGRPGATMPDCDDGDPLVHPGDPARGIRPATEVCDGQDNECDGVGVDNVVCPVGGEACSRTLGECVTPSCVLPEFQCGVGSQCVMGMCRPGDCATEGCTEGVCDPVTHTCVVPRGLGEACTNDAECIEQRCVPRRGLGVPDDPDARGGSLCTRACCNNSNCPSGFECWAPGTGVRACVRRSLLERGVLRAPDPDTERNCSHPSDCSSQACRLSRYDAVDRPRRGLICGGDAMGDTPSCRANDECASGVCLFGHPSAFGLVNAGPCAAACRTSADCQGLESSYNRSPYHAITDDPDITMGCAAARAADTSDWVQLCLETSGAEAGAECRSDVDCVDRACVEGQCRATCCADSSCAGGDLCRPIERGDHWEMLCAPPLTLL